MLTREEILEIYEAGPEAVITAFQRLESIIEKQASQSAEHEERVRVLEARLNQNSQNSSKPPSSDAFCNEKPKVKSRRSSNGKKPGGQKGHSGKTLEMTSNPDYIIIHSPLCCENCGHNLETTEVGSWMRGRPVVITQNGKKVIDSSIPIGTAIGTFTGSAGSKTYSGHTAIYGNPSSTGLNVWDQNYLYDKAVARHCISYTGTTRLSNINNYYVINV